MILFFGLRGERGVWRDLIFLKEGRSLGGLFIYIVRSKSNEYVDFFFEIFTSIVLFLF